MSYIEYFFYHVMCSVFSLTVCSSGQFCSSSRVIDRSPLSSLLMKLISLHVCLHGSFSAPLPLKKKSHNTHPSSNHLLPAPLKAQEHLQLYYFLEKHQQATWVSSMLTSSKVCRKVTGNNNITESLKTPRLWQAVWSSAYPKNSSKKLFCHASVYLLSIFKSFSIYCQAKDQSPLNVSLVFQITGWLIDDHKDSNVFLSQ